MNGTIASAFVASVYICRLEILETRIQIGNITGDKSREGHWDKIGSRRLTRHGTRRPASALEELRLWPCRVVEWMFGMFEMCGEGGWWRVVRWRAKKG